MTLTNNSIEQVSITHQKQVKNREISENKIKSQLQQQCTSLFSTLWQWKKAAAVVTSYSIHINQQHTSKIRSGYTQKHTRATKCKKNVFRCKHGQLQTFGTQAPASGFCCSFHILPVTLSLSSFLSPPEKKRAMFLWMIRPSWLSLTLRWLSLMLLGVPSHISFLPFPPTSRLQLQLRASFSSPMNRRNAMYTGAIPS